MAAISKTSSKIAPVFPMDSRIRSRIANEAIDAGEAVYILTTGKVALSDASAAGTALFHGIALNDAGAGQPVDVLEEGEVYGFTLSGNAGSPAYLSDTAGGLDDAAGTVSKIVGRIVTLSDVDLTKVLRVSVSWL